MQKLNYLDYAFDINKIEKELDQCYKGNLKNIFDENISKKEAIEKCFEIMNLLINQIENLEQDIWI